MKNKLTVIGIIVTTVILAGVAIFTALRLYQTRDTAVAPNVPSSKPAAAQICGGVQGIECPTGYVCQIEKWLSGADRTGVCVVDDVNRTFNTTNACVLNFTLQAPTATPTPTVTATATAVPQCNSSCSSTADCPSNLTCYKPNGATAGNCRNTSCTTASNCFCSTATPTATATTTATPTTTATSTPTSVATVTPTATSAPQCNYSCTSNSGCPSSMICYIPSGQTAGNCRNTQCLSETDCLCPNPTATATNVPQLPEVGTKWPTIVGTGFGILVILGSLLLAL